MSTEIKKAIKKTQKLSIKIGVHHEQLKSY